MSMLALVTNDDGVGSAGIRVLARAALAAGLDVLVAAPPRDTSGASASLTSVEKDGRFLFDEVTWAGEAKAPGRVVAVEAAPAFIVRAAFSGAFGNAPDIVLSGVNHGPNTGHAVLHSGTVGAALTASTHGCPSMAVSTGVADTMHWDTTSRVIATTLGWMLAEGRPVVLNVNVPNIPLGRLRGIRRARLAAFGAVQATVVEAGQGSAKMAYDEVDDELEPGTDAAFLADGYACFTPLQAVCEAAAFDTATLESAGLGNASHRFDPHFCREGGT